MHTRPSARLLVLDPEGRVLLFRFAHPDGAKGHRHYWATPGGRREAGESFAEAAIRELAEETGMVRDDVGPEVARRQFVLTLPDGEEVLADERFFVVRVEETGLSRAGWTEEETQVMAEHRWWHRHELEASAALIFPENLAAMLRAL